MEASFTPFASSLENGAAEEPDQQAESECQGDDGGDDGFPPRLGVVAGFARFADNFLARN